MLSTVVGFGDTALMNNLLPPQSYILAWNIFFSGTKIFVFAAQSIPFPYVNVLGNKNIVHSMIRKKEVDGFKVHFIQVPGKP